VSVRIVIPADGTSLVTFPYGDGTEILPAGQFINVPPGSALETAIGVSNLTVPTAQQLASAANGGAGGVSN
jgi:hypothetical protein